jgi:L-threonylcarbamoyladenylate synthase
VTTGDAAGDGTNPEVRQAVEVLRRGGLIGLPTETVYGLGADASNEAAVRRIFAAKGRPADHPLIVHIASASELDRWALDPSPIARLLAAACWPGPLTLLVHRASHVLDVVTGGRTTVGLRVPSHPLALAVLRAFGGGIAAPSANRFGKVSPTTADHVRADLGTDVDYVLDGGPSEVGVESTIVDCTVDPPQILRPGGVSAERIRQIIDGTLGDMSGPSRAAGMMASHYAPDCTIELVDTLDEALACMLRLDTETRVVELVDLSADAEAAARDLYELLRDADARKVDVLVVVQPSAEGIGAAVRDRLSKAAH